MRAVVVIPTYNEIENIRRLIPRIHAIDSRLRVLVVDDSSPDGTGRFVRRLSKRDRRIELLERERKEGLGRAYVAGFRHALARGYDVILQMDADFSHDPAVIPEFFREIRRFDQVNGSRYIGGRINVINWPLERLALSYFGNVYARLATGLPLSDLTGGYKCYRRKVLEGIGLDRVRANGYAFQIEMNYLAHRKGFRIGEIPIVFNDRHSGSSKLSGGIVREGLFGVLFLRFRR